MLKKYLKLYKLGIGSFFYCNIRWVILIFILVLKLYMGEIIN